MARHKSLNELLREDIIDTRDLIELIDDLEEEGDQEEIARAKQFAAMVEDCSEDYLYGAQVIADHYFTEYARELADDIGAIPRDGGWPTHCIDWEWAARELKMDYSCVDFEGRGWWVR